ncbi:hypothetical protein [Salmonella enterica]|uniref:hypothetical protein n=1 Tax=Salmonella enterica TaxID=28901 RepID=UPI0011245702|nr:hypothetical protein [Salmonella enterica]TPB10181.1 hypothetical protein E9131_24125 [Salmonella enterica subsp. enterica serovar Goldcoast]
MQDSDGNPDGYASDHGDVTPPDDGGNVTPPDDGGDDNVIPPDDSGDDDVTPPDDSGDDDESPTASCSENVPWALESARAAAAYN